MAGPELSEVDEKAGGGLSSLAAPAPVAKTSATALLSDAQKQILNTQLASPEVQVSFLALYRYADGWDWLIIAVSVLCAIAAGAALPLLSVSSLVPGRRHQRGIHG